MSVIGKIIGVNSNLITVHVDDPVALNEVGYAILGDLKLMSEIVRIRGSIVDMQVFENTEGLTIGDEVEFTGNMLSVELGPGLLTQIFDGLQNPLPRLAKQAALPFLERGIYLDALDRTLDWEFTPKVEVGTMLTAGETVGIVPEGIFEHRIMLPFQVVGKFEVTEIKEAGTYKVDQVVATLKPEKGGTDIEIKLMQTWPVKIPIQAYSERMRPTEPLVTQTRIIDTFFPVARGGTFCIPGPFGAGKTVLQQQMSKYAEVDIVIVAACGERAGEVVETLREFPELSDPKTGKSLMERTIIICNTSSMPVAAREASVYTAITIAEYYRQMGLNVLLIADSTSRWAQALRERSGRLEEIPGEEAFPAYLESVIAGFYERGGIVRLKDDSIGSVTVGGTVSPAGGNFDEPVTQATLKVVGAFLGLSRARSDARRFPAVDPLDSWSKYNSIVPGDHVGAARDMLYHGSEINQMMKVVGEEGTSIDDFVIYLKAEYLDAVYLQQNAFNDVDAATSAERQAFVFDIISDILHNSLNFKDKADARRFFHQLTQTTKDWNITPFDSEEFKSLGNKIKDMVSEVEVK
jgi:V/A-type H+-transporting ATPase subunit A